MQLAWRIFSRPLQCRLYYSSSISTSFSILTGKQLIEEDEYAEIYFYHNEWRPNFSNPYLSLFMHGRMGNPLGIYRNKSRRDYMYTVLVEQILYSEKFRIHISVCIPYPSPPQKNERKNPLHIKCKRRRQKSKLGNNFRKCCLSLSTFTFSGKLYTAAKVAGNEKAPCWSRNILSLAHAGILHSSLPEMSEDGLGQVAQCGGSNRMTLLSQPFYW